jgi:Lon protease-like protein
LEHRADMEAKLYELPLFPLSVVLFPGQTLPLHIFEPRYRVMIRSCIEHDAPFGVVLLRDEPPHVPHTIGTSARVTDVRRLSDGRMNILTVGEMRFQVHNFRMSEHGYLVGEVSALPFVEDVEQSDPILRSVLRLIRRYLTLIAMANEQRFNVDQLPVRPVELAVFTAVALDLPLEEKQKLLAQACISDLLKMEESLLRQETKMLQVMLSAIRPPDDGLFFLRN